MECGLSAGTRALASELRRRGGKNKFSLDEAGRRFIRTIRARLGRGQCSCKGWPGSAMSIRMASPLEPSLIGSPWHLMATTGAISPTSSYVGLSALVANYTLAVTAPTPAGRAETSEGCADVKHCRIPAIFSNVDSSCIQAMISFSAVAFVPMAISGWLRTPAWPQLRSETTTADDNWYSYDTNFGSLG
jgi:hypothetical protein